MNKDGKIQNIKYAPPPPELPVLGRVSPNETSFIGRTNYVAGFEEKRFVFGIKRVDRRKHMYMVGKSGVGKSKLFELLVRQDIFYGRGVCVIDPHGEIIDAVLDCVPKHRVNDVCIIDPTDAEFPISFNPLVNIDPMFRHQLAQSFIEVAKKQLETQWTPRLEHLFRFTILALLDFPHATMMGMISMLTDSDYRSSVIPYIKDEMVKKFWNKEFLEWAEKYEADVIIPLVNKLSQFLSHPLIQNIFKQKENKIDFESLIQGEKIICINLSKGKLGEENANFLGSLFISKIKHAGMMRASIPEWGRKDFYVYIDEFQNLVTETFENLLSESRKYGICLTLSHQYMGQLTTKIHAAIIGNVGTIIVFRVGGEDAERLEIEMTPIFKAKDMINLGIREFYIKMTIDGETHDPFSADTLKVLSFPESSFRTNIISLSREQYATPRGAMEK
ncbi:type IV secretory system conjugative DNA transfer family protein [Candidatus Parcubacteria bacterium]|jgi:type IV secretory pathway TraG/TraD family ATPase VirD4|nr:MAG: type IV secretory system conjugative DNA transfer family protein [Candidatus Parcubacteria bacterium]